MRQGRYYLNRIIKINLTQDKLIDAICNPSIIKAGKYFWTFTDIEDHRNDVKPFIYGCLSKYADGAVKIIDENNHKQISTLAPNLLQASSPFVYFPEFSGLCFLAVYNEIQHNIFPKRFKDLIEITREKDFLDLLISCDVEPISDYTSFHKKLSSINKITDIQATIYPPNPLFGRLWKSLKEYLEERNVSSLNIKEHSEKKDGINTNLPNMVNDLSENLSISENTATITDAAILMAADGYGQGKVLGTGNDDLIIEIKTSDTKVSFLFEKEPTVQALAKVAYDKFLRININRKMGH